MGLGPPGVRSDLSLTLSSLLWLVTCLSGRVAVSSPHGVPGPTLSRTGVPRFSVQLLCVCFWWHIPDPQCVLLALSLNDLRSFILDQWSEKEVIVAPVLCSGEREAAGPSLGQLPVSSLARNAGAQCLCVCVLACVLARCVLHVYSMSPLSVVALCVTHSVHPLYSLRKGWRDRAPTYSEEQGQLPTASPSVA